MSMIGFIFCYRDVLCMVCILRYCGVISIENWLIRNRFLLEIGGGGHLSGTAWRNVALMANMDFVWLNFEASIADLFDGRVAN